MRINDKISGFTVKNIRPLEELQAEFVEMTHDKTGLELVWINRREENKTFGIAFKTLPFDDTGVFHILEHSVLCGSQKYPVKEPFVDLLQTSMSTFLNALTFPDKTLYPISSRNDKDFFNLMSVYLDAVFKPAIYTKPEIFLQEGWHYELDENGNASYKGVVFNEMKGVFASADELGEMAVNRALFPETAYRYVSGGDPASIPDLTYESFIETHKKFYSPSNAYVFLDGELDIEGTLDFINSEYLADAEKGERINENLIQSPVDGGTVTIKYELGEDEGTENKRRISFARVIGGYDERERLIAMQVLSEVLCGGNQSLLTKAVLSKGLAEDVTMQVYDSVAQPWVKIEAQNLKDGSEDEAEALIFETLRGLVENGIDRAQLEASMANLEFQMRERDYGSMPQGIVFSFIALETWLYGGDAMKHLVVGDLFDRLRAMADEGYFEKLINDILIENSHRAKIILEPSHNAGRERREAEAERINSESELWSDKERAELIAKQERLIEWQSSADSEEAVATLPKLELCDVSTQPEKLPVEEINSNKIRALLHNINCSGILNLAFYFDAEDLDENELCALSFLTDILGKMKTEAHSEEELDTMGRLLFGMLDFAVSSYPSKEDINSCKIKLCAMFSTLEKNLDKAIDFVTEVLTETSLENEATALDLIKQLKTKYFQQFVMSGSGVGAGRIRAGYSAYGVAMECTGGIEYYRWLCDKESNWDWRALSSELGGLIDKIVCSNRLTISLTGGTSAVLSEITSKLYGRLNEGSNCNGELKIAPRGRSREGIIIPADICFACAGGIINDFEKYKGEYAVASRIISYSYLWNTVRVQGGAYGCGCSVNINGIALSHSYRDPNGAGSLEAYKHIADFLEKFADEEPDLTGFIIGTIAGATPLLTPKAKGFKADEEYFKGISYDDKRAQLEEMLNTTPDKLRKISQQLRIFDSSGVCVLGSREQLDACELDKTEAL